MPIHRTFSPEELRLNDYAHGRGAIERPSTTGSHWHRFVLPKDGLVRADIPAFWRTQQSSCRTLAATNLDFGGEGVTLRVGQADAKRDFLIHRSVIAKRSPYIEHMLRGEWKEAQTGVVDLTDDEPDVVALYQTWLYSGRIFSDCTMCSPEKSAQEYSRLVKCYIFGDKVLDGIFKDCVIDCIISLLLGTQLFDPSLTSLVYESTHAQHRLRRLWQDIYITCGSPSWLDEQYDPHPEFAIDLSRRQLSSWPGACPQGGASVLCEPCRYHEHADGTCYRTIYAAAPQTTTPLSWTPSGFGQN